MLFRTLFSLLLTISILAGSTPAVLAFDEGMFPPDKIVNLPLVKKGLKIKPTDVYNPKGGGLSEAVIRLDTGCTGEFVSPDGLILTNHHCGFDALVSASSVGQDYGKDGYKADSRANELPAKDYSISIPIRTEDVTSKVLAGTENLTGEARDKAIAANIAALETAEKAKIAEGNTVRVQAVSNGYFYYLYENKQIKDIRVVYAPPQSIGFFGGDPDNFEWTRHTGDFTFLRAYVAPDGKSADYSANNVPYKPRKFLTISLNGVKENDFVFVMGNPGGTTRYRESQSVKYARDVNWPFLVDYLGSWIKALEKVGETDEEKRIKLQADIFSFANSEKAFAGGVRAVTREKVVEAKRADEMRFDVWANANAARKAKYGSLLSDIARVSSDFYKTGTRDRLLRTVPFLGSAPAFGQALQAMAAASNGTALTDKKKEEIEAVMKSREPIQEREMVKFLFRKLSELPADQKFAPAEALFDSKQGKARKDAEEALAASIANNPDLDSADDIKAIYSMSPADLKQKYGKLFDYAVAHVKEQGAVAAKTGKFNAEINSLRMLYMRGMSEMKGISPYPDANFTQRFTYGNVKGYQPREAVTYSPFTTLKGVLDKETGIFPFTSPQKLIDLQNNKDFGRYGVGDSVPVNFLSTNDIIGGNSGSPIMNAYGEQVGIVFDGNYEGLGNDMFFSPNYGRTISVDIRYVLFVTEKFGGAGWILDEMKIKGGRVMAAGKGR